MAVTAELADQPPTAPSAETAQAEPARPPSFECDLCGETFEGPAFGSGLLLWTRGDEVRAEEPPLCEECAQRVGMGALAKWALEDEEEG
ncbi:MAG: hypothetical protein IT376_10320 [Polyangiaceae bacterium]|nr:hypothetical protein [Polyangiaceae bacterium]